METQYDNLNNNKKLDRLQLQQNNASQLLKTITSTITILPQSTK